MKNILPVLGLMVCMYALAELIGTATRKLEEENKMPLLHSILTITAIGLLFCSAPIGLINMLHDSRIKALNDKENAERYRALQKIDHRLIDELKSDVARLEEEKLDIRFETYDRGTKDGYRSGYIDGYVASCENALSEEDSHLALDWRWKRDAQSAAQNSLKRKEHMGQAREDI